MGQTHAGPNDPEVGLGPPIEQARQGTGSHESLGKVLDPLRRALAQGPASGSDLARRLHLRKRDVLAGLRTLLAAGQVRRLGRDSGVRFILRDPGS
jgi:hypothetical protein